MDNLSATGTSLSDEVFGYVPPNFLMEHGLVKDVDVEKINKSALNVGYDLIPDKNHKDFTCDETKADS